MKIVAQANETVLKILRKPKNTDGQYRNMYFCAEHPHDNGVLMYNLLTKELLFLTQEEYSHRLKLDYLREHWFVVPKETNDKEHADMIKWVLATRQKKSNEITSYTIFTTTDCNARCFYCFELGRSRVPMSEEIALKVVQYIKQHCGGKKVKITWFGGEPLYNQKAIDTICLGLLNEGIEYSSNMITNGYLFDAQAVQKAVDLWHLNHLQITMDGTEAVYNRVKAFIYKEGNPYQIVLGNMERLLDAGIFISIRMNLDLYNAEDLMCLVQELALRFSGNEHISAYVHHLFEGDESMADTHTEAEWAQREEAMCRLEECIAQSKLSPRVGIPKKMKLTHCMADNGNAVTIMPDGSVGLCEHFSDSEVVGHIDCEGLDPNVVASWKEVMPPIEECATCFCYPECIKLKKCPNENKCFRQFREGSLRKTHSQMENEYQKWLKKAADSETDDESEFC